VRDITTKFGKDAGRIWHLLNERGTMHKEDIVKETTLNEKDLNAGIGWLARENKIRKKDESCYHLDQTNLDNEIGAHAGRIWKILDIWEEVDYESMKRLSDLSDQEIHAALGWLAREDKISYNNNNKFNLK
jgi:hypothetical protein